MDLLSKIKEQARRIDQRIVLPEASDTRTLQAADLLIAQQLARVILLGSEKDIHNRAKNLGLQHLGGATVVDPADHPKREEYAVLLHGLRKHRGLSMEEAQRLSTDPLYLATLMIKNGDADGEVAGAINATGNVLRPAFQIIKTQPGVTVVSGAFIMIFEDSQFGDDGVMVFADCAVNPDPDAEALAQIAICTAQTARAIAQVEPRVAMLSFSTKGSAAHPLVDKVVNATKRAREMAPGLLIDGELQADAAIMEAVGKCKAPGSTIAGHANVLVFPSLEAGNIAYKLVQRMARAQAVGPILQGLAAPINDLSRGCSVDDIVNLVAITANQAMVMDNHKK